jgi:excisionase family DNA binding protein
MHRFLEQSDDNTSATQPVRTRQVASSAAEIHSHHDDWSAPQEVHGHCLLLTVSEAAQRLGIGRSLLYELLDDGQVESIHVGRRRRIPTDALATYIPRQRCNTRNSADRAALGPIRDSSSGGLGNNLKHDDREEPDS